MTMRAIYEAVVADLEEAARAYWIDHAIRHRLTVEELRHEIAAAKVRKEREQ